MGIISAIFRPSGRRRIYADLMQLDDHLLRDIGLTRAEVREMSAGRRQKTFRTHE